MWIPAGRRLSSKPVKAAWSLEPLTIVYSTIALLNKPLRSRLGPSLVASGAAGIALSTPTETVVPL